MKESYAAWIGLLARLVTGGMWLVAGMLKLPDPAANVRAVRAYELLPESAVTPVGHLLPLVEVALGVLLLLGLLTRTSGVASSLLLLVFVFGIAAAWARGLEIECGCFGGDGGASAGAAEKYPWEIARDVGLLLLSAWLVWRPRTRFAVDSVLFGSNASPINESPSTEGIPDARQVR